MEQEEGMSLDRKMETRRTRRRVVLLDAHTKVTASILIDMLINNKLSRLAYLMTRAEPGNGQFAHQLFTPTFLKYHLC